MTMRRRIARLERRAWARPNDLTDLTDEQLLCRARKLAEELGYIDLPPKFVAYFGQSSEDDS